MDVSFEPRALVEGGGRLRLNAPYYLTKVIIPALHRLFTLAGADIWVRHDHVHTSSCDSLIK